MSMTDVRDREHALEGSVNFRDLGGLAAADGQVVRTGRLFRSDALSRLTDGDLERLQAFGIKTLIDLRTGQELERYGLSPLRDHGVKHLHVPLIEQTGEPTQLDPNASLGSFYILMLERADERIKTLFESIADPTTLPAVVHCTAGKDRTGITIALVLRTIGVADSAIVADYAMTDRNMARLIARLQTNGQPVSQADIPEQFMRAIPETMETFLAALDERWGSVHGYLDSIDVDDFSREAVHANLLTDATSER